MTSVAISETHTTLTVGNLATTVAVGSQGTAIITKDADVTVVTVAEITSLIEVTEAPTVLNLIEKEVSLISVGEQGPPGPPGASEYVGTLNDLTDVQILAQNDGQLLEYDGLTDQWVNRSPDKSPVYTYSGGNLSRIDYPSGNYKLFTYFGSRLTQLQYVLAGRTVTKVFSYNPDGTLASVSQTESYN